MTVPFDSMDCVSKPSPFQSGTFFLSKGRFQNCKDWFLSVADLEIVNGAVKGRFLVYHQQAPTFRPKKRGGSSSYNQPTPWLEKVVTHQLPAAPSSNSLHVEWN